MANRQSGMTLTTLTLFGLVLAVLLLGMLLFALRAEQRARQHLLRRAALRQAEDALIESRARAFSSLASSNNEQFSVSMPNQKRPFRCRLRVTDLRWDNRPQQALWLIAEIYDGETLLAKAGELRLRKKQRESSR